MQTVLLVLLSIVGVFGVYDPAETPPCLRYAYAPISTSRLSSYLTSSFTAPNPAGATSIDDQIRSIVLDVVGLQTSHDEAALFFGLVGDNKFFLRLRNCSAPEFSGESVCQAYGVSPGLLVEAYCPYCADANVQIFTYTGTTLSAKLASVAWNGPEYTAQFWFTLGSGGNGGWFVNSGIPELGVLQSTTNVFVQPVAKPDAFPGQDVFIAVAGGVRSADEPCNPSVDCVVGDWSSWSDCDRKCGGGFSHRSRPVLVPNQFGGNSCGDLGDVQACNSQQCDVALTGKARTGIVIACVGSFILAALIFCIWSERKPVFKNTPRKQHSKKQVDTASTTSMSTHTAKREAAPEKPAKRAEPRNTADDDDDAPAPKAVQLWV